MQVAKHISVDKDASFGTEAFTEPSSKWKRNIILNLLYITVTILSFIFGQTLLFKLHTTALQCY